jgi:hypothetical protein
MHSFLAWTTTLGNLTTIRLPCLVFSPAPAMVASFTSLSGPARLEGVSQLTRHLIKCIVSMKSASWIYEIVRASTAVGPMFSPGPGPDSGNSMNGLVGSINESRQCICAPDTVRDQQASISIIFVILAGRPRDHTPCSCALSVRACSRLCIRA